MKRLYEIYVERGTKYDSYTYQVVADEGLTAGKKAIRQAREDSGYRTLWRVCNVEEKPGFVVE